jgi:hypothetical protein
MIGALGEGAGGAMPASRDGEMGDPGCGLGMPYPASAVYCAR